MRHLFAILLMLSMSFTASSGSFYGYTISPESWVSIQGTTNVNSFECRSDDHIPRGYIMAEAHPVKNAISFADAFLELEISSFDCQNRRMNRDLQEALGADQNPYIRINLLEANIIPGQNDQPADKLLINVAILLNGVVKNTEVMIDLSESDGYRYYFKGSKDLLMSDFNIDPPSPALGLIKVRDTITINFNLLVEASLISRN